MKNSSGETLSYYLPEPAKAHTILHIPGSHTLYVGPSSCTRRHAIEAEEYGDRRDVSFLYVTEADVISGDYEDVIGDAVEELMEVLEPSPHIFLIAVFCIDDFLGTDEKALTDSLSARFADRRFTVSHIDPVSLGENKKNHVMKKYVNMFQFIAPQKRHDGSVLITGNFIDLHPDCEFADMLRQAGATVMRELRNCETYEDYQNLGKSSLAVGMRFASDNIVSFFEEELEIPFYYFPHSYDADFIAKGYGDISEKLSGVRQDWREKAESVRAYAEETARILDGRAVVMDSSASMMVFEAALSLLRYGFNVEKIFISRHIFPHDEKFRREMKKEFPDAMEVRSDDYREVARKSKEKAFIAIGADSAKMVDAGHFIDVWHDEGFFGFHGIMRLMKEMRKAMGES